MFHGYIMDEITFRDMNRYLERALAHVNSMPDSGEKDLAIHDINTVLEYLNYQPNRETNK